MDPKPDGVRSWAKSREWDLRPGETALGKSTLAEGRRGGGEGGLQ